MIRRRHVFYIEGYDPQGISGYFRLFRRELTRAGKLWPIQSVVSEPELDADGIAGRWQVETKGPNWQVSTTYEFLRLEDLIRKDLDRSMVVRFFRVMAVFFENLLNGTTYRVFRASWRFGLFYVYPTLLFALAVLGPAALGLALWRVLQGPLLGWAAASIAVAMAVALYAVTWKFKDRWFVLQLVEDWLWGHDWIYGKRPDFDARLDAFAQRIVARAQQGGVDELIVFGHSAGATVLIPVIARALEIDPAFARAVPRLTIATLGSALPLAALHPRGRQVRDAVARVAVEPSLTWVDCQARKDVINFTHFDTVSGIGLDIGPERCNPIIWQVRHRDMLEEETYRRIRWNFFRVHYQFVMANNLRAPYDYFMFVCGPAPLTDWVEHRAAMHEQFAPDASYTPPETPALRPAV